MKIPSFELTYMVSAMASALSDDGQDDIAHDLLRCHHNDIVERSYAAGVSAGAVYRWTDPN